MNLSIAREAPHLSRRTPLARGGFTRGATTLAQRLSLALPLVVLASSCGESTVLETLRLSSFEAVMLESPLELAATPAFADERGGGVFVDLAGRVVRVRPNGSQGVLESHPQNGSLPGPASGAFPLSGANALVSTERGLFVADRGWLIAPQWQSRLSPGGIRGTALGVDGTTWLAHDEGLFRIANGALSQLTVGNEAQTGVRAVASAPTHTGALGVWFARGDELYAATPSGVANFAVRTSGLTEQARAGGIIGLAGLSPTPQSGGELWAITKESLLSYSGSSWRQYVLPASPRALMSAGRIAWMQAGDALYRYDADQRVWAEATGLPGSGTLLGVDASGVAWVRVGTRTVSISPAVSPRVLGLLESTRVFEGQLQLEARLPFDPAPSGVSWRFDDGPTHEVDLSTVVLGSGPTEGQRTYSLGGVEASGVDKPVSLASLADGWHTLRVSATWGYQESTRAVSFEFLGSAAAAVSYESEIAAINQGRCAKCHSTGTEPELATYQQWKANAASIAAAVRESRMPADGPLSASESALVIRWVNGGALP